MKEILINFAHDKVILSMNKDDKEKNVIMNQNDFDWDYYSVIISSICSKMSILLRIIPSNLSWIATLSDIDITIIKILDNNIFIIISILKKILRLNKNYLQLNEKYIYKFNNIFIDKLLNKLSFLNISYHHIILKDEKIFINDRIFHLLTRY